MIIEKIAGTYEVIKYGYTYKTDNRFEPISDWFSGSIHYSATGFMSVIMRFSKQPQSLKEVVAYSGTYTLQGEEIIHQVTTSVRPEYDNETLTRKFFLTDGELELEFENTAEFRKFAVWKKVIV